MILLRLIFMQTLIHAFRKGGGAFGTLGFYIMVMTLFTFALGAEAMRQYAPAAMCVAMLLACITALPLFYERDYEDGTLEQFLLYPVAMEWVCVAKILGQWLAMMAPIVLISPVITLAADMSPEAMLQALTSLLLASLTLVAIGSIASALTLGSKRGGLLQALVMLPLCTPILIFAANIGGQGAWLFLGGLLLISLPFSCLISAMLIRMSID